MSVETKLPSEGHPQLPVKKLKQYIGIIAALHLLGLLSALLIIRTLGPETYKDFHYYYNRTKLFWQGENPYVMHNPTLHLFRYLPLSLVVFVIFIIPFELETSILIWVGLSEVFFLAGFYLVISMHNRGSLWDKLRSNLSAIILLVGTSFPLYYTFVLGQINAFVFFAISVFLYFSCKEESTTNRKNQILAGLALSFAIAMKLTPGLLFLLMLYRKQFWGIITTLGTTFLSILIFVTLLDLPFYTFILDWINLQNDVGPLMLKKLPWRIVHTSNILIMADSYLFKINNLWIYSLLLFGIVLVLTVMLKKQQANPELLFCILNVSMLFIGGSIWFHHLTMIYPTIILLLSHNTDWVRKPWEHIYQNTKNSKLEMLKQRMHEQIFLILPILIFGAYWIMPLYLLIFTNKPLHVQSTYESTNLLLPNVIYSVLLFAFFLAVLYLGIRTLREKIPQ